MDQQTQSSESNALSKRTASKGFHMSVSAPADSLFFGYILQCSDGSLYVGNTTNVAARVTAHDDGRGALWTACRHPVSLVYHEQQSSEEQAIARERQIKRWTHAKKLALIHGELRKLKSLARRRVR